MREPNDYVLLVGGDLLGTDRVMSAATSAGFAFRKSSPARLADALAEATPALLVVDLDGGREEAIRAVEAARDRETLPSRVVGYFSHVDAPLAEAARAAGIEAMPRGRLWRSLDELLATPPD